MQQVGVVPVMAVVERGERIGLRNFTPLYDNQWVPPTKVSVGWMNQAELKLLRCQRCPC